MVVVDVKAPHDIESCGAFLCVHAWEYVSSGTFLGLEGVKEGFELFAGGRCPVMLLRGLW